MVSGTDCPSSRGAGDTETWHNILMTLSRDSAPLLCLYS